MAQVELLSSATTLVVFDTTLRTITFQDVRNRDNKDQSKKIVIPLEHLMIITHRAAGQLSAMASEVEGVLGALEELKKTPQDLRNEAIEAEAARQLQRPPQRII